ncbi:hypothetical protein EOL94_03040 [bacterium]|nr:hypothetical protein [bacterium]
MKKSLTFLLSLLLFLTIGLGFFVVANNALALDVGINEVNSEIGLASSDPRVIGARIIQIALGFLGLIAVVLILYAGFLWMTAEGDENKVAQAKRVLKNAIIGLIIILSSWGITVFILNRFMQATNNGGGGTNFNGNVNGNLGTGVMGACSVESVYPEPGQKDVPRNTSVLVRFKEPLNLETVCEDTNGSGDFCDGGDNIISDNIKIYVSDDEENLLTNVKVAHVDKKDFVFIFEDLLGSSSEKTWYTVEINNNLVKENEEGYIFDNCSSDSLTWDFQVGTFLDLMPPMVKNGGVFPPADNGEDSETTQNQAIQATGNIVVSDYTKLKTYQEANISSVTPSGGSPDANADIDENYHQQLTIFSVSAIESGNQAQLFQGTGANAQLIMTRSFVGNTVSFENFFTLNAEDVPAQGNSWTVVINPEVFADTLTVGNTIYTFADNSNGNNIEIGSSNSDQASKITVNINNSDLIVTTSETSVILVAKVAGSSGNGIDLSTTNTEALNISGMLGGLDENIIYTINDKKDQPRNSVIQINFSEPINPLTVSGESQNVSDTIRVVNNNQSAIASGGVCSTDSDCLSYNCNESNICEGDELSGKFILSNNFKTIEFISNNICGMNGCGETIYCLPENANLKVVLETSNLNECSDNSVCAGYSPYTNCNNTSLGYKVCQDDANSNYPLSETPIVSGIVDTANNSFDGNRDNKSDGPIGYYSENDKNTNNKDGFLWTFWLSDYLAIEPPKIDEVTPNIAEGNVNLIDPVNITFTSLMMKGSLRTGSVIIESGNDEFEHNLINLWGVNNYPLGYWINSNDSDSNDDGIVDKTIVNINHSLFSDSMAHYSEVGSGVKDIYQNCYKPSSSLSCEANDMYPSCCNGVPSESCSN